MRYLGFVPEDLKFAPLEAIRFVADQLKVSSSALETYGGREQTQSDHFGEVREHLGYSLPRPQDYEGLLEWLVDRALEHDKAILLLRLACDRLRAQRIVRPPGDRLVRLVGTARQEAQSKTFRLLEPLLTPTRRAQLDRLLTTQHPRGRSRLAWLGEGAGGKVLALNMPAGSNPALARAIGVMLKNAWLQALLMRPKKMKESPSTYFRPAVFICDEYQAFASVGEDDPTGDEKSFALTRQCRCIPIVATQSISSLRAVLGSSEAWRALLQTLRTRIFLSLSDDASAKIASELCGQVAKIKGSYTISETSKRAGVSPLSGRAGGGGGSIGATKSFREQREAVFHPRDFTLLSNCQAICLPYDGAQSLEPRRVYLKPHYLPAEHSYWRAKEAGQI